ncbi:MAG: hypothetical protein M3O07_13780 [Pseudomonadota bacterium]|nr:hypothetical protein [Pseudomonadota bacterium]
MTTTIAALWIPILLSAIVVFIASAIIHMAPLWHRSECPAVPDQDRLMDALRPFGLKPGEYMVPRAAEMKDCKSPEFVEKLKRGPVLLMTVMRNEPVSMTKPLIQWFIYTLIVGVLAAYVASRTLAAGTEYLQVFQIAGTTAFIGYAVGLWQQSIWYNRPWSTTAKHTLDGLIYALLTGGVFGWLWPAA